MPKFAVTVMVPRQFVVEVGDGKTPVELTAHACTIKDGGKQPALCVPLKDFVRYDLIEEKSPIVAPDGGEPGKIVS